MADLELHNPEFDIVAYLSGEQKTINVKPDETSDGVAYFVCSTGDHELTQIRKEESGEWEQMWGELSQPEIDSIGKAIEQKQA